MYQTVTTRQAKKLLEHRDLVVIDVRNNHAFKQGHLYNALNYHNGLLKYLIRTYGTSQALLIYGSNKNSHADIARYFHSHGFHTVYYMERGFKAYCRDCLFTWYQVNGMMEEKSEFQVLHP